jgi:hypothetical protein
MATLAKSSPNKTAVVPARAAPMPRVNDRSAGRVGSADAPRRIASASAIITAANTAVHTQNISHQSHSIRAAWTPAGSSAD